MPISSAMWASSSTIRTRLAGSMKVDCAAIRAAHLSRLIELFVMNRPLGEPKNLPHARRIPVTRQRTHPPAVDAHHALAQRPRGAGAGHQRLANLRRFAAV